MAVLAAIRELWDRSVKRPLRRSGPGATVGSVVTSEKGERRMPTLKQLQALEKSRTKVVFASEQEEKEAFGIAWRNRWTFGYPEDGVLCFSKAQLRELEKAGINYKPME